MLCSYYLLLYFVKPIKRSFKRKNSEFYRIKADFFFHNRGKPNNAKVIIERARVKKKKKSGSLLLTFYHSV